VAAMRAGVNDYILKENMSRLIPAIQRELREGASRKARRDAEKKLNTTNLLLAKTFESLNEAVFVLDAETLSILQCNRAVENMFGFSPGEMIGKTTEVLHVDRNSYNSFHENVTIQLKHAGAVEVEYQGRRRDGSVFFTENIVTQLQNERGNTTALVHVVRDVDRRKKVETELRSSHKQLRALAERLQTVREEERTRIAREIHDELGGAMTGLKMDIAWISKKLNELQLVNIDQILGRVDMMCGLMDATIQTVRRISAELRPGMLDDLGLLATIQWQAKEFERRTNISCRVRSETETMKLDEGIATGLFRIFQEALTNVARHSNASIVETILAVNDQEVTMSIKDNGRGITDEQIQSIKSLGLLGMRERAQMIGGTCDIHPFMDGGTEVRVRIVLPLSDATIS